MTVGPWESRTRASGGPYPDPGGLRGKRQRAAAAPSRVPLRPDFVFIPGSLFGMAWLAGCRHDAYLGISMIFVTAQVPRPGRDWMMVVSGAGLAWTWVCLSHIVIASRVYVLRSCVTGAASGVFRLEGDCRALPGADCGDTAAQRPHRKSPGCRALMKRRPPAVRSIGIDRDSQAHETFACYHPVVSVHGCGLRLLASFPFLGPELVCSDPPISTRPAVRRGATASTTKRPTTSCSWNCSSPCPAR